MSSLTREQKRLAKLLRVLAEEIESDRGLAKRVFTQLEGHSLFPQKRENQTSADVFQILAKEGKEGLVEFLNSLQLVELKKIIGKHRLDPSGRSLKWRNKQRLISLITERTESRSVHGDVFMKDKEDSVQS
jgi:hypothetical protein